MYRMRKFINVAATAAHALRDRSAWKKRRNETGSGNTQKPLFRVMKQTGEVGEVTLPVIEPATSKIKDTRLYM